MLTESIKTIAFGIDTNGDAAGEITTNAAGDRVLAGTIFPAGSLQDTCAALRELIDQPAGDGIDDVAKYVGAAGHTVSWDPVGDTYKVWANGAPFTEDVVESLLRACTLGGLYTPV